MVEGRYGEGFEAGWGGAGSGVHGIKQVTVAGRACIIGVLTPCCENYDDDDDDDARNWDSMSNCHIVMQIFQVNYEKGYQLLK